MNKKHLLFALFVGLSFFLAGMAFFRSFYLRPEKLVAGGFGVSPPQIIASLFPGESFEDNINILRSDSRETQSVYIKMNAPKFAGWVTMSPTSEITLWPGDFITPLAVGLDVPPDALPGAYRGSINLTLSSNRPGGGVNIELGARVDILLEVKGNVVQPSEAQAIDMPVLTFSASDDALYGRFKGFTVSRTEAAGEAYYVHPETRMIYYLNTPEIAFSIMAKQGIGITDYNLAAIPPAVLPLAETDSDGDGLPDELESALGTDKSSADSDGDRLSDLNEIAGSLDPLKPGAALMVNNALVERLKGRILLQVEKSGAAWYLNPGDKRRYYLGRPAIAWQALKQVAQSISEDDFYILSGQVKK